MKSVKEKINGMDINSAISKEVVDYCKANNLLIIHGASDGLLEFNGKIYDELGAYGGFDYKEFEVDNCSEKLYGSVKRLKLKSIFCPDKEKTWKVTIDGGQEYETFNIIEDGKVFCEGLIVKLDDHGADKIDAIKSNDELRSELGELAKPLLKFVNENLNPHARIIIDCDSAEIINGVLMIKNDEFIKD